MQAHGTGSVPAGPATCMMLFRRPTTKEFVAHFTGKCSAIDTRIVELAANDALELIRRA